MFVTINIMSKPTADYIILNQTCFEMEKHVHPVIDYNMLSLIDFHIS